MNKRLIADFLLDLAERPAPAILEELHGYRASYGTLVAFKTAEAMSGSMGGWASLGEWYMNHPEDPEVYVPLGAEMKLIVRGFLS